jgi:hypothetical protein
MQFKNPEILYFLFLLIVPILVHLFQLRRFKKEYFTNVRFLKEISIQTRKSASIKKWLLLACRLLLLTCIIIAFAQPYFLAEDSKNVKNELYIILDNSFSMQAKGKKGELLKRAVQDVLENTPEGTPFTLLTNDAVYWNTDSKEIKNALLNLNYSSLPFQLDSQIAKIRAHKSAFNKDIVIVSDVLGLEQNQLKSIDEKDQLFFIVPKAEQKNNIAVDSVYIKNSLENFYEIDVVLSRHGDNSNAIPIAVYNESKLIAKTIVNFESNKKTAAFTIPKKEFHGYVSITDNDLPYDNQYYFTISKNKKPKVLSIGAIAKSEFLSRIYTPTEFDFHAVPLTSLDYNSIDSQDVIVVNELEIIPQALQTTLKSFVSNGGNLIFIPSTLTSIENANPFLKQFGSLQFQQKDDFEKLLTEIHFNHPLFNAVFESKVKNFQYPITKSSFVMTKSAAVALENEDQTAFLSSLPNPLSTVYVFSAALNTVNSNFQQSPLIVPTFYNMAMNSQNAAVTALSIGNTNPFIVAATLSKDAVLEVKNNKEQFIPLQQVVNNKVKMVFNDYPEQAGNFEIYNQNQKVENISFNYIRTESARGSANEKLLADYTVVDSISTVFDTLHSSRTDNQMWKWFAIFALLFLVTETAIIRFMK